MRPPNTPIHHSSSPPIPSSYPPATFSLPAPNPLIRPILHIEGLLQSSVSTTLNLSTASLQIAAFIASTHNTISLDHEFDCYDPALSSLLLKLVVTEVSGTKKATLPSASLASDDSDIEIYPIASVELAVHLYRLFDSPIESLSITAVTNDSNSSEDAVSACRTLRLPSASLEGLWEGLVFESGIKEGLLGFMETLLLFGERGVRGVYVGFNRLVLLHGPPGSGKTSLAKALAQKLAIRMSERFERCWLVEVNSHNLFSKFFSESGKLVGRLFESVVEMLEDEGCFVVLLIDEVETLVSARKAAASGNEPTDGLRVVNALLTALDKLRLKKNVLVITTSNLLPAMDPAFLDRCDIKQFIDCPRPPAAYAIFRNSFNELIRTGIIISNAPIPCANEAALCLYSFPDAPSSCLWRCAEMCKGFSGRTLGKLPVLMHARYVQRRQCGIGEAMEALERAVGDEVEARGRRLEVSV